MLIYLSLSLRTRTLTSSSGNSIHKLNWATEEQLVWVRDAQTGLSSYFDKWYRQVASHVTNEQADASVAKTLATTGKRCEPSEFRQWVKSRTSGGATTGSEIDRYMLMETQETDDPISWWLAHQASFPGLSQLALDVFAIPAMATDCEMSFSLAKLCLTSQRLSTKVLWISKQAFSFR